MLPEYYLLGFCSNRPKLKRDMPVMNGIVQDSGDQPLGNDAPPTPHPALHSSQVGIAESTRMKAAQRFQQHLGRGVQIILRPPQDVATFSFEMALAGSPVAGLPDTGRMGGPRLSLFSQAGKPGPEPVQAFSMKGLPMFR